MERDRREPGPPEVSVGAIFLGFLEIAVSAFGGALPWVRRTLVERRGWLTDREFAELLGVCQVLPCSNTLNIAISVGTRYQGAFGALAAFSGLLLVPFLIVCALGLFYHYGVQFDPIRAALRGVAAVAAALYLANGLKLTRPYRRQPRAVLVGGLAFVAVGLLRLPLIPVLLVLGPFSIGLVWFDRR